MIRINIIGSGFLDMATGGGLSFKRDNQQFRFCDISLGRSVEFSIPSTRHNRRLLGYGDDPAMYGDMMRDRHDVQVIHDFGAFRATLNVTGYEGEAFKCVLLLDTMPWLASLQDIKLKDMACSWSHGHYWDNAYAIPVGDPSLYTFLDGEGIKIVQYDDGVSGYLLPSVNVKAFIEDILTEAGVPHSVYIPREYWIVMSTAKGTGEATVTMVSNGTNDLTITGGAGIIQAETVDLEWATGEFFGALVGGGSVTVKAFKALEDIDVTFPSSFPTDCYLVQYSTKLKNYSTIGGVDQYGNPDPHGGSLGRLDGKTVSLKKGYIYFFAPNPWQVDWGFPNGYIGYKDTFNPFSFSFKVTRATDLQQGELWYMRNNMPDMTLFDFIKSAALAAGMEVLVDINGIYVGDGSYAKDMKECSNVLSVDSVSRCVDTWGNTNRKAEVCFDSEDYVTNPIRWGYFIDNDTLEGSKETKVKFSEGTTNAGGTILIKDIDMSGTPPKITAKKPTIAYADPDHKLLVRVPDVSMVGYDDIAADSTCIRMKMRVDNKAFFDLKPTDAWLWRGMAYVWTSADWSDGVLSLTLQKVSQAVAIPSPPVVLKSISASFNQGGAVVIGTDV